MRYSLEAFIGKIDSPVVCVIGDEIINYASGKALLEQQFDKYYLVSSIKLGDQAIIVELKEQDSVTDTSWIGEEQVSFF